MERVFRLCPPLNDAQVRDLTAGDWVEVSGVIYTARDAALRRLCEEFAQKGKLPFSLDGQIIYFMGPTPARPGSVSGAAGPTTAGRMDAYAPQLLEWGLKGMIGKGEMGPAVAEALQKFGAVYMAAIGGAGALMARSIRSSRVIAYEDLGPEAVLELTVENMLVLVAQDSHGGNAFISGRSTYAVTAR
ncbi:MAG: FumA C-terminus/TtdB family hydratase beta subunit [candidate division KSB1 bacterium]|nr:FumA C-terminus/TtdB family hydratase beta subunit [candidate division KSB1 bacterium]